MREEDRSWIRRKLQEAFLATVRSALNEQQAANRAANLRSKCPGLSKDALAKILTNRAIRKTAIEGFGNGAAITGAEAVIANPAPEGGQRALAISAIAALLVSDIAYTTKIQMQLLLEIGEIYECPFSKDDEDDVWLILKSALGIKGIERVGAYARFIGSEIAEKQFRKFLREQGRRRAAQEALRRIAGREVAKYLSEKVLLRLIAVINAFFGAGFNAWVTRRVGKWAKVKAKIRVSILRSIDELIALDRTVAILALPISFLAGTADGDSPSENFVTLYAHTSNRVQLKPAEIELLETLANAENLESVVEERLHQVDSPLARSRLMDIAITAAAASHLKFNSKQHELLSRLNKVLDVDYSRQKLEEKIEQLVT